MWSNKGTCLDLQGYEKGASLKNYGKKKKTPQLCNKINLIMHLVAWT